MKKSHFGIFCLAIMAYYTAPAQLATNLTITNLQGKVYRNITLDHTNTLGVVWVAADGSMGEFKYTDLAMEYWDRLNLSDSARNVQEAVALRHQQEQQARMAQEESARQQAELAARLNREVQDQLSATNSEEQKIDAIVDKHRDMSPDETAARDGLLKALLDISSSTAVGVNRNDYGELLAKATSALAFGKIKLPVERHQKYLLCAEKAIDYYSKANDEWSDYFKYDWERDQDETLMTVDDFYDLRQNGSPVDTSAFRKRDGNIFYVPFHESLTLYWQAADIYVHKMQKDAQQ
jgi:hypothetical protein